MVKALGRNKGKRRVWIRERKLATRTSYQLRWYDSRGRSRSETVGSDREEAEWRRREKEQELNARDYREPIIFDDFCLEYFDTRKKKAPTTVIDEKALLRQLKEFTQPVWLSDIDARAIDRFVSQRSQVVKPATVNKNIRVLKSIFAKAVRWGYLEVNPLEGVAKFTVPDKELRVLSVGEVRRILDVMLGDPWWETFFLTLYMTAMRRGEILNLEWRDIDFEDGEITVRNKVGWQTKSRRNRALRGLDTRLFQALSNLRQWNGETDLVFSRNGRSPDPNWVLKRFQRLAKQAGIPPCTIHDMRRTRLSHLAENGVPPIVLKEFAGHSKIETTLQHYVRVSTDGIAGADKKVLSKVLGPAEECGQVVVTAKEPQFSRAGISP